MFYNNDDNNKDQNLYEWDNSSKDVIQVNGQEVPGPEDPFEVKKKPKKKMFVKGLAIACAMILCVSAGYVGRYFSEKDVNNPISNSDTPDNTSGQKQLYQASVGQGDSAGKEYSVPEIAEMTGKSVVEITTEQKTNGQFFQQYVTTGAGSGVIISEDGYIITNNHVIEKANNIKVKLKDDDTEYTAKLIGTDPKTDIAVIKIEKKGLQPAIFGDSSKLRVGETVVAVGNPLGSLGGTVTNGIISALDRDIEIEGEIMKLLQTNAAINPGNSGGGLFNTKGELVGVVNAKSSGTDIEGLGFAIPSNVAKAVAEDLINHGYVKGRVTLGISVVDIQDTQTAMMYRVQQLGLYIQEVKEGSSAEKAGLQSGDRFVSVNGKTIAHQTDLTKIIDEHSVGDTLDVVVARNGQDISCKITLQEYQP